MGEKDQRTMDQLSYSFQDLIPTSATPSVSNSTGLLTTKRRNIQLTSLNTTSLTPKQPVSTSLYNQSFHNQSSRWRSEFPKHLDDDRMSESSTVIGSVMNSPQRRPLINTTSLTNITEEN